MGAKAALVTAIAAVTLCACINPVGGHAVAQQPPTPRSPWPIINPPNVPTPPGRAAFPDLNTLAPADLPRYAGTNWHHDQYETFTTDSGWSCLAYVYSGGLNNIICNGTADTDNEVSWHSQVSGYRFWTTPSKPDKSFPRLPAGQRLSLGNTGCGVTDELVACIDGGRHGFVASPRGNWTF